MVWNNALPSNTSKIRNLGSEIRPNWAAIEQGDATLKIQASNLKDRTVAGLSVDPTAIADTFIIYCKESAAGDSEFYGIDENSNVIQLSAKGRIGGPTSNYKIQNFQFSDTTNYTRNNIIMAYGRFDSAGTTIIANNCSIARTSAGTYVVTLNPDPGTLNYVPVVTPIDDGTTKVPKILPLTSSTFRISISDTSNVPRDTGGFFHVVGGF